MKRTDETIPKAPRDIFKTALASVNLVVEKRGEKRIHVIQCRKIPELFDMWNDFSKMCRIPSPAERFDLRILAKRKLPELEDHSASCLLMPNRKKYRQIEKLRKNRQQMRDVHTRKKDAGMHVQYCDDDHFR